MVRTERLREARFPKTSPVSRSASVQQRGRARLCAFPPQDAGGCVYAAGSLLARGSSFEACRAATSGGGLYGEADVTIVATAFRSCDALSGAGGAAFASGGQVQVANSSALAADGSSFTSCTSGTVRPSMVSFCVCWLLREGLTHRLVPAPNLHIPALQQGGALAAPSVAVVQSTFYNCSSKVRNVSPQHVAVSSGCTQRDILFARPP